MTDREPDVKYVPPGEPGGPLLIVLRRSRAWMDEGPMVGWKWIALWGALNLLVNLLDLLG